MSRISQRPNRKARSRYKGVHRSPSGHRWRADLYLSEGKSLHLGSFDTEQDAALAYDLAALQFLGTGAFLNFRDTHLLNPIVVGEVAMIPFRKESKTSIAEYGHFLVDSDDLEKVKQYYWRTRAGSLVGRKGRQNVHLSTLLTEEVPENHAVAHINANSLDNRKENLAVIPIGLLLGKQLKQERKCSSIYKGVKKAGGRWSAQLAGKHLSTWDVEEDAARAYDAAARERFGIYAAVNFPREGERGCLRRYATRLPLAA
ncbi:MAG: hypothetical protein HY820_38845 [Acidobacteria bacterium]|nr:hypothetical protein [Acidobacteriota bacterium]